MIHCETFCLLHAAAVGGPNACGRCNKTVYAAEKVVGAGKVVVL